MIALLLALQVKHLVFDWVLQDTYIRGNKYMYGHLSGIFHAALNAIATGICFEVFFPGHFLVVFAIDFIAHYHIDWAKMNIARRAEIANTDNTHFWWLTGLDQFLHQVTYIGLLALVMR